MVFNYHFIHFFYFYFIFFVKKIIIFKFFEYQLSNYNFNHISSNIFEVFSLYSASIVEKENLSKNINYQLEEISIELEKPTDLSVIFYIGESTSRLHWSIYKYFRSTNKNLEKFNEENRIILYDNIYSTHTHTSPSLLDTLTIKVKPNDENI